MLDRDQHYPMYQPRKLRVPLTALGVCGASLKDFAWNKEPHRHSISTLLENLHHYAANSKKPKGQESLRRAGPRRCCKARG